MVHLCPTTSFLPSVLSSPPGSSRCAGPRARSSLSCSQGICGGGPQGVLGCVGCTSLPLE